MFLYYYHHPHHHPLEPEPEPESKPKFAPSLRVCWFLMPLGLQLQLHCLRPPPPPPRHPLRPVLHSGQTSFLAPLTGAPLPRRFGWTRRGSNIWQPRSDVAKNRTTLPPAPTTPPAPAPPPTPTASIPIQPFIHSFMPGFLGLQLLLLQTGFSALLEMCRSRPTGLPAPSISAEKLGSGTWLPAASLLLYL
uniref:HDC10019 n=1 Tax=Drosophila melanogaster TaxID=7227 RepID=Q6IL94_DROME|nr:TPA_inf: HDC10019 [Drosophila melanogaster]